MLKTYNVWREYVPRRGGLSLCAIGGTIIATGVSPFEFGIYLGHDGRLVNGEL